MRHPSSTGIASIVVWASLWLVAGTALAQIPDERVLSGEAGSPDTEDVGKGQSGAERGNATAGSEPWKRGVSQQRQDAARRLMREGNRLFKIPLFLQAAAKYEEAIALWDHPAFRYNLAVTQLNLVQPIDAHENFEQALRHGAAPLGEDKFQQATQYLETLEKRLARLKVACEIAGAEVTLNGVLLFKGPGVYDDLVNPGQHQLVARKPEHVPDTKNVTLAAGESATQLMVPIKVTDVTRRERHWAAWKPWIVVGAGAGLLAGAGYLDWNAAQAITRFDEDFVARNCHIGGCERSEIPDLVERLEAANTRQNVALGLYIAAGLTLTTGAVLAYINRERLVDRVESSTPRRATLTPVLTPNSAMLSARFRY